MAKLLVVEDDPFLSSLLKVRLNTEGFTVLYAADGEAALTLLRGEKPDLMLMDLILPKKSGFEVMEAIQGDPQLNHVPIIIISNLGQDSDIARGKELGAVAYFVKAKTSIDFLVEQTKNYIQQLSQKPTPTV
jgi:DNA-binding response OmpR family regulator